MLKSEKTKYEGPIGFTHRITGFLFSELKSRIYLFPILTVWLAFVAWRPFFLGFYHDDWSSVALPLERSGALIDVLVGDPARPLYVLVLYAVRFVLGAHFGLWQALMAILHLACAIGVSWLVNSALSGVAKLEAEGIRKCSVVAGLLWLIFPWSLGYSAWAIMMPPLLGMLIAIIGLNVALRESGATRDIVIALVLISLSWLIYEATWFICFPFSLILLVRGYVDGRSRSVGIKFMGGSFLVQVAFIVLNRILSFRSLHGKRLTDSVMSTLSTDVYLFKVQLSSLLGSGARVIVSGIILLVSVSVFNLARSKRLLLGGSVIGALVSGLLLSIVLYAAAGYAIEWIGLFSRVTLPLSLWVSVIIASLYCFSCLGSTRSTKALASIGVLMICIPMGSALVEQAKLWKESWSEQQQILQAIPNSLIDVADRDSLIIMNIPRGTPPVYTFSSFWDISGAIIPKMSKFINDRKPHAFATVLREGEWRTTWDGAIVQQYWCSSPASAIWGLNANKVYLWNYPSGSFRQIAAPYDSGCIKN